MRVALSQRVDFHSDRGEYRDGVDQRLCEFISSFGSIPIPVPNTLGGRLNDWLSEVRPEGILLSGGQNIGLCESRDLTEETMIKYAISKTLPILGVCRGAQLLAIYFGGCLAPVTGHVKAAHKLSGEVSKTVICYHSQKISKVPKEFEIIARAEDGTIEGIRHKTFSIFGWMWHPERAGCQFDLDDLDAAKKIFSNK